MIKGVGVQFLDVFNQALLNYSLAIDEMLAQPGNKYTSLAKSVTTDQGQVHFQNKTGTNYPVVTVEGAAFAQDSRLLAYKTTVVPQLWSNSVTVTYQALEDRDYNRQLDEFGDLTIGMQSVMDRAFFDVFNYAFTVQGSLPNFIYPYGDGRPLCSISHPRIDGGANQRNTFTAAQTQLVLSDGNLETLRNVMHRHLDDRGIPIRGGSGKLILLVSPENEKLAVQLAKSELRPGTANNEVNIYDGLMTVVATKWLGYTGNGGALPTTAWFLIDPKLAKLLMVMRQGIKTHTYIAPNTLSQTFYIISRFASAWCDWRGVVGSLGDVSGYTN